MRRSVLLAVVLGAGVMTAPAGANIEPGSIAAPWFNPYPTQPNVTYNGALPADSGSYHALDYLRFTVANPGETIEFTDQNTTTGINPNTCSRYCPLYLSLIDRNQVGLGDGAGTYATYADTEFFDWTFSAPGTYYMVMESNGDEPLSYAVSYRIVSGGPSCTQNCFGPTPTPTPPAPPPLVRSVHVLANQTGTTAKSTVTLGQWARSVRVALLYGKRSKVIAAIKRAPLDPGRHKYKLALPPRYQRMLDARHKLSLVVRITVTGRSGHRTFNRHVTMRP